MMPLLLRAGLPAREIKRAPLAIANVDASGVFEGYASLFGVVDLGRDVVMPGAFRDTLARRGAAGVKMLWQHKASEPIGTWLSLEEDQRGLRVTGRLNLAVAKAREVLALMRDGAVDGLSIGFRADRAHRDQASGVRSLKKIDLWEISLVTFPMLPQARVTALKRMNSAVINPTRARWIAAARACERSLARGAHALFPRR
jgi:HK97 family phage prohead protease